MRLAVPSNSQLILWTTHMSKKKKTQLPDFVSWDILSSYPQSHMCGGSQKGHQAGISPMELSWRNEAGPGHPGSLGSTLAFPVLGSIRQGLFICFDFCTLSRLKTSVMYFLDCKYGPCLVAYVHFAPSRRRTKKNEGHLEGREASPTGNKTRRKKHQESYCVYKALLCSPRQALWAVLGGRSWRNSWKELTLQSGSAVLNSWLCSWAGHFTFLSLSSLSGELGRGWE